MMKKSGSRILWLTGISLLLGFGQLTAAQSPEEPAAEAGSENAGRVVLGDERSGEYLPVLDGKRVALFSNQSGITGPDTAQRDPDLPFGLIAEGMPESPGEHILDVLLSEKVNVTVLMSPEHGFRGASDAGYAEDDETDEKTGIPIFSLYNEDLSDPSWDVFDTFDVCVMDIQDVGLRFYTYYITMYRLMDACAREGKSFVILDRPNPNGFYVDGPILEEEYRSGVGMLPIPIVHGLTLGELACMINGEGWLEAGKDACDLTVIPCENYDHQTMTGLVTRPSPNLKDMRAVYLYPSTCLFENTVVSVGRGTMYPFEIYGSPLLKDAEGFDFTFEPQSMDGALTPPFEGETCYGKDLRQIPLEDIRSGGIRLSYIIDAFEAVRRLSPDAEFFGQPDDSGRYWIDLLTGTDKVRHMIEEGKTAEEIKETWQADIDFFLAQRRPYLLYAE